MGASAYQRDRKRVYAKSQNRGKGYRKAGIKALNKKYGAESIRRNGKVVAMRSEDDTIMCQKKSFPTRDAALDSLRQIAQSDGAGQEKPKRIYSCPHCCQFHLTHLVSREQPADIDHDD